MKRNAARIIAVIFGIILTFIVSTEREGLTETPKTKENDFCLTCHGKKEDTLKNLIYVNLEVLSETAHRQLSCTDCHEDAVAQPAREGLAPPHPKRLKSVNCTACHFRGNLEGAPDFTPMQQYQASVHGRASIEKSDTDVAVCSDCHGKHNIRAPSDPESTIHRSNIPRTCAVCHENMQMILKHNIHVEQPYTEYQQSVHGKASLKDGSVTIAAVCTDCHGVHDIQANGEADLKPHLPGTCGRCHLNEYLAYTGSIHGKAFKQRIPDAPVCADCHGEHNIAAPWNPDSSVSVFHITGTCAKCHDDVTKMSKYNILTNKVSTFEHSDHGMGSDLGIVSVATCVSCHGYHDILPAHDPESSINPLNLEKTCGSSHCHLDAPSEILHAKIHVDKANDDIEALRRIRSIALWSIAVLLCLGFATGVIILAVRISHRGRSLPEPANDPRDHTG